MWRYPTIIESSMGAKRWPFWCGSRNVSRTRPVYCSISRRLARRRLGQVGGRCDPGNHRQNPPLDVLGTQRTHLAVSDMAGAIDDIGFGHAVDPEIDRRHAVTIDRDSAERVAEFVEEAAGRRRLVFVSDAVEGDIRTMRQRR